MKQTINRTDGITYERKVREKKYDTMLWTRFNGDKVEQLKKIAEKQGTTLSILIRTILEEYIEKEA